LIGPLYAHLYRDPASGEIMKRLAPRVAAWVERMVDVKAPLSGEFLPDDEVPQTLMPVLERMMGEQMPFLQTSADMLAVWSAANPDAELPRAVGMAAFTVEGIEGQRIAPPFSLWMLQRALEYYRQLEEADKSVADEFLSTINGALVFRNFAMERPLAFENFKLGLR
jgi:hypothetical protein